MDLKPHGTIDSPLLFVLPLLVFGIMGFLGTASLYLRLPFYLLLYDYENYVDVMIFLLITFVDASTAIGERVWATKHLYRNNNFRIYGSIP